MKLFLMGARSSFISGRRSCVLTSSGHMEMSNMSKSSRKRKSWLCLRTTGSLRFCDTSTFSNMMKTFQNSSIQKKNYRILALPRSKFVLQQSSLLSKLCLKSETTTFYHPKSKTHMKSTGSCGKWVRRNLGRWRHIIRFWVYFIEILVANLKSLTTIFLTKLL